MKTYLYRFAIAVGIVFFAAGCSKQPSASAKDTYTLDESRTVAPKKNGKLDGVVEKYAHDGKLWSTETYAEGVKNGPSKFYAYSISAPMINQGRAWVKEECDYKNGKKDGVCKKYDLDMEIQDGKITYERYLWNVTPYSDGEKHGVVKIYSSGPLIYIGNYLYSETPYSHGKKNGTYKKWTFDEDNKRVLDEVINYRDDRKWGEQITHGLYHQKIRTYFKDGVEVGPRVTYYTNGEIETKYFDAASLQAEKKAAEAKREKNTQKACAYAKRYLNTPGALRDSSEAAHRRFEDATIACKYGWVEGDGAFF